MKPSCPKAEIPNTKLPAPEKQQAPNFKSGANASFGGWKLELLWSLDSWCLELYEGR